LHPEAKHHLPQYDTAINNLQDAMAASLTARGIKDAPTAGQRPEEVKNGLAMMFEASIIEAAYHTAPSDTPQGPKATNTRKK
jgi:hypothetical protein